MPNLAKEAPSKIVDSTKEVLPGPSVIALSVEHSDLIDKYPREKILAVIAKETTMPNTDVVQFGNTVFITHVNEDGSKSWGRAFNVDTAQNFVANGYDFIRHLRSLGIERYFAAYDGDVFDSAFRAWHKRQHTLGVKINVQKKPKANKSYAFIELEREKS